jgi:hypothetical protein
MTYIFYIFWGKNKEQISTIGTPPMLHNISLRLSVWLQGFTLIQILEHMHK